MSDCFFDAAHLSCSAMRELAIKELRANRDFNGYAATHPVCERLNTLADRGIESSLQKTTGSMRKVCLEKSDRFQDGPWTQSFTPVVSPVFNVQTKMKTM